MRITNGMLLNDTLAGEARASLQTYQLTQEASSGQKINNPSDDPAGYATVVSTDAQISVLTARQAAMSKSGGDLSLADGVLSSASDLLVQAKSLATTGADGSHDANWRANAATQVNGIIQQMIALGNTQGANGYIFGGTKTQTPPFDAAGNFSGNGTATQMEVADGVLAQTNASGAQAFTAAGGRDVIGDLKALSTALSGNNVAGIQASMGVLDTDNSQVIDARVNAGVAAERLQSSSDVIANALTAEQAARANVADADVPTVYSELSAVQTSYESALSVNRQLLTMFQTEQQLQPV
jgi:flagellar hook-associated protein 3 FlgL